MSICAEMQAKGINIVGVPKTIDNDLMNTDRTFGFDTAVAIATEAIDRLQTTGQSHERVMILETMGRYAGWIALEASIAGGADIVLIPEIPYDIDVVAQVCRTRAARQAFTIIVVAEGAIPKDGGLTVRETIDDIVSTLRRRHRKGIKYSIVVVAEGVLPPDGYEPIEQKKDAFGFDRLGGVAYPIAAAIEDGTGFETRVSVLGHVQRGGTPTASDRILSTRYGTYAGAAAARGEWGRMVSLQNGHLTTVALSEVANKTRTVPTDDYLIKSARAVGMSFGVER